VYHPVSSLALRKIRRFSFIKGVGVFPTPFPLAWKVFPPFSATPRGGWAPVSRGVLAALLPRRVGEIIKLFPRRTLPPVWALKSSLKGTQRGRAAFSSRSFNSARIQPPFPSTYPHLHRNAQALRPISALGGEKVRPSPSSLDVVYSPPIFRSRRDVRFPGPSTTWTRASRDSLLKFCP